MYACSLKLTHTVHFILVGSNWPVFDPLMSNFHFVSQFTPAGICIEMAGNFVLVCPKGIFVYTSSTTCLQYFWFCVSSGAVPFFCLSLSFLFCALFYLLLCWANLQCMETCFRIKMSFLFCISSIW